MSSTYERVSLLVSRRYRRTKNGYAQGEIVFLRSLSDYTHFNQELQEEAVGTGDSEWLAQPARVDALVDSDAYQEFLKGAELSTQMVYIAASAIDVVCSR